MSGGAFPHINQLKPAPGIHLNHLVGERERRSDNSKNGQ
jgi:hypothetical protein